MMMIRRRTGLFVFALALVLSWAGLSGGALAAEAADSDTSAEVQRITLEEAYATAQEQSPKIRMARLELEDARLAFEQTRSQSLMRPDPVALLQAESTLELARRNLALVQDQVRLEVAENYLGVLRLENLMDVMQGSLVLAERQSAIAENRFEVGSAAKVEIIRSANQVSNARANLLEMQGSRELALMAFRMGVGLPLNQPVVPDSFEIEPMKIDVDLEEDLKFALENRLEIVRARNGVDVARKQVELTENDYTPAIARARAQIGLQRAEEGVQQAKDGIELEIRQIYQSLMDNERRLKVLEESINEASETLTITEDMYDAGVATDVEVLSAQTALTQSQTDRVNTLFDLRTAQVRYMHATARMFTDEGGDTQ